MQLHLVCATIEGKLLHTARKPTGTWYPFEEIKDQAGSVGPVLTLSCAGDHCTTALHVCTVSKDGRLRHTTYRVVDRSWSAIEDVATQVSAYLALPWLGLASIFGQLHLCVLNRDRIRYLLRGTNGSWSTVGNVVDPQGNMVGPYYLKGAGDNNTGQLHLCGITPSGHITHLFRPVDSTTWSVLADLTPGPPGDYGAACAVLPDGLHVCGGRGRLKHLIRQVDGHVSAPEDVTGQVGTPGAFADVVCASVGEELHVCAVTASDGRLWHTIRQANGSWSRFAEVAGDPGNVTLVSVAGLFLPG